MCFGSANFSKLPQNITRYKQKTFTNNLHPQYLSTIIALFANFITSIYCTVLCSTVPRKFVNVEEILKQNKNISNFFEGPDRCFPAKSALGKYPVSQMPSSILFTRCRPKVAHSSLYSLYNLAFCTYLLLKTCSPFSAVAPVGPWQVIKDNM